MFGQIIVVYADQFGLCSRQKSRILFLMHVASARTRHDDLVSLLKEAAQRGHVRLDFLLRSIHQTAIQEGQAAALLVWNDALDPVFLKDGNRRFADLRLVVIDGAGIKEGYLFVSASLRGSRLFTNPLSKSLAMKRRKHSIPVDAQILFH